MSIRKGLIDLLKVLGGEPESNSTSKILEQVAAAHGNADAGEFVINVQEVLGEINSTYTIDKTKAEIVAAIEDGSKVVAVLHYANNSTEDLKYDFTNYFSGSTQYMFYARTLSQQINESRPTIVDNVMCLFFEETPTIYENGYDVRFYTQTTPMSEPII